MLCPKCKSHAPGGSRCAQCGDLVPEQETFAGQGGRYLLLLCGFSIVLAVAFLLLARYNLLGLTLKRLFTTGWIWVYAIISVLPLAVGLRYWFVLRNEEVIVTDHYISRRSHWGDVRLEWSQVRAFRHRTLPLRQTRLGRVTWFSRFFADQRPPSGRSLDWLGASYELIGPTDDSGNETFLRLEPGTIEDMLWLLDLIEDQIGPPEEI